MKGMTREEEKGEGDREEGQRRTEGKGIQESLPIFEGDSPLCLFFSLSLSLSENRSTAKFDGRVTTKERREKQEIHKKIQTSIR